MKIRIENFPVIRAALSRAIGFVRFSATRRRLRPSGPPVIASQFYPFASVPRKERPSSPLSPRNVPPNDTHTPFTFRIEFSSRLCFTFPPFAVILSPQLFISFAYRFPSLWIDGNVVRCPGYNPVRSELERDCRDGPRVVANGVPTIPRTTLDGSFISTNSWISDSLKPATVGLSDGRCGENSLDVSCIHASAREPFVPILELFRRRLK